MSKTSYKNTSDLNDAISKKIKALNKGKLSLSELDELVGDAQQLYEQLVVLRFQAFDRYGEPKAEASKEAASPVETPFDFTDVATKEQEEETVEEPKESVNVATAAETEEIGFDFTMEEEVKEEETEAPISFEPEPVPEKEAVLEEHTQEEVLDSEEEEMDDDSLYSRFKAEGDDGSLRKKLQNSPISDIKEHISIAKKFEYISQMFSGDSEAYHEAIDFLNNCARGEDARMKLDAYSKEYQWDMEDKSILKFVELIDRRYPD